MQGEVFFDISLDFVNPQIPRRIRVTQYSKILPTIRASIFAGGQAYTIPDGATVNIRWKKPSGTVVYDPVTSFSGNAIQYQIDAQAMAAAGICNACFEIVSGEKAINTPTFSLEVAENPVQDGDIEDSDQFGALEEALQETIDTATEQVGQIAAGATSEIASAVTNAKNELDTAVDEATAQAQDGFNEAVQMAKDQAGTIAADATAQAKQYAENAAQSATESESSATRAEEAANRAEAAAPVEGYVVSINGLAGVVKLDAENVPFDPTGTPFISTNVQDALEELLSIGGGGQPISTITVTSLAGTVIVLSQGAKSYTQTVGPDAAPVVFRVIETGTWNVTATHEGQQESGIVDVAEAGGSYSIVFDFVPYKAYITVTAPDGATVKAAKGDKNVSGIVSGTSATLTVSEGGEWSVSATYLDGISETVAVDVQEEGETYSATPAFCTLAITAPEGSTIKIKNGLTTLTGEGGTVKFWLPKTGTWNIAATKDDQSTSDSIECSEYKDYTAEVAYFAATITVSVESGATVTASLDGYSAEAVSGPENTAVITVIKPGLYTVSAVKNGATSSSQTVQVSASGKNYTATVVFVTLTVTAPAGSSVQAQKGVTVLTDTVSGESVKFYLPEPGTWTVTASLDGQTATASKDCSAYRDYSVELAYFSATIKVTVEEGATVTATLSEYSVSGESGSDGSVTLAVLKSGAYTVSATKNSVTSESKQVQVLQSGRQYTAALAFITLTVTAPEGSTITAKNGATTLTDTGGTVKFYLPSTGTWAVTASKDDLDASAEVECSAYQDYSVELAYIQEVLADNSWDMIKRVSDADEGANWWSVGDTKPVVLNGKVGILNLSNLTIDAFILGFNHNSAKEGTHRIHFALGKIGGKQVALCDSQYDSWTGSTCFHMNSSDTNSGGWNATYMRKTILGNSGTPSSPPANSLLAALPADLRAVMKSVTKYTDNTGGSNSSSAVTPTTDYLWPMAEFEVYGTRTYANQYEKNSQQQYAYFKAGNAKVFYNHSATGTVVWVWSRSPFYYNNNYFVMFHTDGTAHLSNAYDSGGLFAGFAA